VSNDHLICDFCDASLYKNHPLFACNDESLKLEFIIYYDEVEITHPLGSHRGKHKCNYIPCMCKLSGTMHAYIVSFEFQFL